MAYQDLVGSFIYKEPIFRAKLDALAENDAALNAAGWAQDTKAVFFQASPPSGWTQDATQNDKALRVVSSIGGGGSGGSKALSSTITLAHTHSISGDGTHTHSYSNHTHPAGASTSTRQSNEIYASNGGWLFRYTAGAGSTSVNPVKATHDSPGSLTLGTEANHDHGGASGSSLIDIVFTYCDVIIASRNAPSGAYTDLTSEWQTGDIVEYEAFDELSDNDAYTEGRLMPAATIMIFGQATAPTAWTKLTTQNDRLLRIVSGAGGGVGGDHSPLSSVPLIHSNSITAETNHAHSVPTHAHSLATDSGISNAAPHTSVTGYAPESDVTGPQLAQASDSGTSASRTVYKVSTPADGGSITGSAGGHNHTPGTALSDFTLAYVDVIQCSKDASGEPYAYTDLTSEFGFKKLVSKQRLDNLAKNDAYVHYHTTPVGTKTFFFMASPPSGWTKITSQHDKALRIVSGSSGGSPGGGSQLLSATITLAHTHTIPAEANHSHAITHTHNLDSGAQTTNPPGFQLAEGNGTGRVSIRNTVGSLLDATALSKTSEAPTETIGQAGGHDHGGATDSQLSNVTLAYADVIYCEKD